MLCFAEHSDSSDSSSDEPNEAPARPSTTTSASKSYNIPAPPPPPPPQPTAYKSDPKPNGVHKSKTVQFIDFASMLSFVIKILCYFLGLTAKKRQVENMY